MIRTLIDIAKVGLALGRPIMDYVRSATPENEQAALLALDQFRARERERIDAALIRKHAR